jgi:hypothetical protein
MWPTVVFVVVSVCSVFGPDVSGRWRGRIEYSTAQSERPASSIFLILRLDGTKLSGSAGPVEDHQFPITDGKIDGDTIVFNTNPSGTARGMQFKLKVSDRALEGDMTEPTREGRGQAARVSLTRVGDE